MNDQSTPPPLTVDQAKTIILDKALSLQDGWKEVFRHTGPRFKRQIFGHPELEGLSLTLVENQSFPEDTGGLPVTDVRATLQDRLGNIISEGSQSLGYFATHISNRVEVEAGRKAEQSIITLAEKISKQHP